MFQIHHQLLKDCHVLGKLNSIYVLLHKNASLHWFILVPKTDCKNLLELDAEHLDNVMVSAQTINQYLTHSLCYTKINFASIGNMVDQLHVHVVGRHSKDACWPKPVWGNLPEGAKYDADAIQKISHDLKIN